MRPSTLAFLVCPPLLWASNAIVGRLAAGAIPPITLNFLRWIVAIFDFACLLSTGNLKQIGLWLKNTGFYLP